MPFSLRQAIIEDAPDIARMFEAAFKDDPVMGQFHPNTPANLLFERDLKMFSDMMKEGDIYGGRWTVVVDNDTGRTVAFSKWDYPYTLTPEQEEKKKARDENYRNPTGIEGSNQPLLAEFRRQISEGRKKWIQRDKTFFFHILAVDPAYQRRGLGSLLIRPCLEAADKAGAQTYIEASTKGLPLYLKHGWEPVDELRIDMRLYGGSTVEVHKDLMREPGAPSKLGMEVD